MEHILPYKVGNVVFVPNKSGIVSANRDLVVTSSMESNNKIELVTMKQSTISHTSSKGLHSAVTDMSWVGKDEPQNAIKFYQLDEQSLLCGDEAGRLSFVRVSNNQLDLVQAWSQLKKSVTSVTVMNFGEVAGAVTTEVGDISYVDHPYDRKNATVQRFCLQSGQIALFSLSEKDFVRHYQDDCAVLSTTKLANSTLATGNLFGQMKAWLKQWKCHSGSQFQP